MNEYINDIDVPFAIDAAALPEAFFPIYVVQSTLIPTALAAFASVVNVAIIRYFQAVVKVILELLVTLSCIVSVSNVSASKVTTVNVVQID